MKPVLATTWLDRLIMKIIDRCLPEKYVTNVSIAERYRRTYLPDINGSYGEKGNRPRPMDQRDLLGRWSLGWRPDK